MQRFGHAVRAACESRDASSRVFGERRNRHQSAKFYVFKPRSGDEQLFQLGRIRRHSALCAFSADIDFDQYAQFLAQLLGRGIELLCQSSGNQPNRPQ